MSSGEDAVWIDDLQIERASLAEWRAADLEPSRSVSGDVLWRIPSTASSDASLRVRARIDAVASPWYARSGPLIIDQPTAVSLVGFEAGAGARPGRLAGAVGAWPVCWCSAWAGER